MMGYGGGGCPPWWISKGIKPAGPEKDMGTWKAIQFTEGQQAFFACGADGTIADQAKHDAAFAVPIGKKYNASFQQTMLRIKDPKVSVPYYCDNFGMKVVHEYHFPEFKFSLYFLERPRDGQALPSKVPSTESEKYLWSMDGTTIELTHNHGAESDPNVKMWSGNNGKDAPEGPNHWADGPVRGFGHLAFNVDDVYATSAALEKDGVKFQKRPDEGRMKGLAFALDPDGYWIEICGRTPGLFKEPQNLSQTMMRVKDGDASRRFYGDIMGMTMCWEMVVPNDFTNFFMCCLSAEEKKSLPPDGKSAEARDFVKKIWQPILELTHNHGTEKDDTFNVHTGNGDPVEWQGFGHIGYLVDDLDACCNDMEAMGVPFFKKPQDGKMHNIAFALDPSGYRIELIGRNTAVDATLRAPYPE
jgi:lactoylglutathione lyase